MSRVKRVRHLAGQALHRVRAAADGDRAAFAAGSLQSRFAELHPARSLEEAEFQVFSQWNEDGIINYLVNRVEVENRTFVEIGVQDYRESNTRFLASHRNWSGLAIDGGAAHLDFISRSGMDWRYGVRPVSAFVTRENINSLVSDHGLTGDIGLLSIDVDGVDYWLFDAIDAVSPRIVVIEYSAMFGADVAVTVPYRSDFDWERAHWSMTYYGASLAALVSKAEEKGYTFVGCESHGVNAFFVRDDVAASIQPLTVLEGFRPSRFPITRTKEGDWDPWESQTKKLTRIGNMPVVLVPSGEETTVGTAVALARTVFASRTTTSSTDSSINP